MALLLSVSRPLGILCIAAYGAGIGLAVPAANLMVAEVNPERRSATLSWLNFCWSTGAVACPFLVAVATRAQQLPLFLKLVSGFSLIVAIGIALMPASIVEPAAAIGQRPKDRSTRAFEDASISYSRGSFLYLCGYGKRLRRMGGILFKDAGSFESSDVADDSIFFLRCPHVWKAFGAFSSQQNRRDQPSTRRITSSLRRNCGTFVFSRTGGSVGERLRSGTWPLICLSDYDLAPVSRVRSGLVEARLCNVCPFEYRRRTPALVCGYLIESFGNAQSGIIDPAAWMRCDVCSVFAKLARIAGRTDSLKLRPLCAS